MLPWLAPGKAHFPPISQALDDPNGLLAAGGELTPDWLIEAYPRGIFPWFNPGEPILWWSPSPRSILWTNDFHCSRSLRKEMRQLDYEILVDQRFTDVMRACAAPRDKQQGTWISNALIESYTALAQRGIAHSVELYIDQKLMGGLYGLSFGRVFFGESMFSKHPSGSKICLYHLAQQLAQHGFEIIDCQVHNPHLESLGAVEVDRGEFEALLKQCKTEEPENLWSNPRWI